MSMVYVRKRKGPRTVPWRTSDNTSSWLDLAPSMTTCCFRLLKESFKTVVVISSDPIKIAFIEQSGIGYFGKSFLKV